jgi:hypothetical protein
MVGPNPNDRSPFAGFDPMPPVNRLAGRWRASGAASARRPRPQSAEEIRLHAWLSERVALLHHERHGLWPKLRRFLFGSPSRGRKG